MLVSFTASNQSHSRSDQDYFEEAFSDPWVKLIYLICYPIGCIGSVGLGFVLWFEKSGQAGHYRTLINQLVSISIELIIIHCFTTFTVDTYRAVFGAVPTIVCQASLFTNLTLLQIGSICSMTITIVKFIIVCVYKSIPVMDDNFLAKFLRSSFNIISILSTLGYMLVSQKANLYIVSLNNF